MWEFNAEEMKNFNVWIILLLLTTEVYGQANKKGQKILAFFIENIFISYQTYPMSRVGALHAVIEK